MDEDFPTEELSKKELEKKRRKEHYQKAKERFKNSDRYKEMTAKQKEMRKEAYQRAKAYKAGKNAKKEDKPSKIVLRPQAEPTNLVPPDNCENDNNEEKKPGLYLVK